MLGHSCAKVFGHAHKILTTPLIKCILEGSWLTKKAVLSQVAMIRERIIEASKFIVGSSCQLSIISNNICH